MVAEFERNSKYKGKAVSKKATGKGPGRFITISGRQRAEEAEIDTDVRNDIEEPLVVEAESSKYVSSALGNLLRAEPPKAATEKVESSKKGSKKKNKKSSTEKATEAGNRKEAEASPIASSQKQKDMQKRGRPRKPRSRSVSKRAVIPKRGRSIAGDQIPRREKSAARRSERNQLEKSVVGGSQQLTAQRERSVVAKSKKKAMAVPSSSRSASDSDASANKDTGPSQSKGDGRKDLSSRNRSKVETFKQERSNGRSSPVGLPAIGNETDGKRKPLKNTEGYELIAVRTKNGLLTAGILTKKSISTNTEDRNTQHEIMDGKVGRNTKKSLRSDSPFDQSKASQIDGDVDWRPHEEKQAQSLAMSWKGLWTGFPPRFTPRSTGENDPTPQFSESPPRAIAETSEHGKKQSLPRKVLAPKFLRVHDRGHTQCNDWSLPGLSCPVGHKRRDSKNFHPSKNPTPSRSSPTFPSSRGGDTHRESKAPFSDGHSITSENAVYAAEQLRNELMSLTSAPSDSDEKTVKIENHAWREIVQAAETLDKKFIDVAKDGSNYLFSDNAINEINTALAIIRKHANHLNMDEKELIAAARDDDETKLQNILCRESPINHKLKSESQVDGWVDMITSYFDTANCVPGTRKRLSTRYDKDSFTGNASIKTFEGRLLGQF
jgi:hypothetical protein